MKLHHLLFGILCFSGYVYSATSQYPCTNALYYARSLSGDDEFLVCQSQDVLSILYGSLKWDIPEIDILIDEENVDTVKTSPETGECHITFHAIPYRLVLAAPFNDFLGEETLTIYRQEEQLKTVKLDQQTSLNFLRELDLIKGSCE